MIRGNLLTQRAKLAKIPRAFTISLYWFRQRGMRVIFTIQITGVHIIIHWYAENDAPVCKFRPDFVAGILRIAIIISHHEPAILFCQRGPFWLLFNYIDYAWLRARVVD